MIAKINKILCVVLVLTAGAGLLNLDNFFNYASAQSITEPLKTKIYESIKIQSHPQANLNIIATRQTVLDYGIFSCQTPQYTQKSFIQESGVINLNQPAGCFNFNLSEPERLPELTVKRVDIFKNVSLTVIYNSQTILERYRVSTLPDTQPFAAALPQTERLILFSGFFILSAVLLGRKRKDYSKPVFKKITQDIHFLSFIRC